MVTTPRLHQVHLGLLSSFTFGLSRRCVEDSDLGHFCKIMEIIIMLKTCCICLCDDFCKATHPYFDKVVCFSWPHQPVWAVWSRACHFLRCIVLYMLGLESPVSNMTLMKVLWSCCEMSVFVDIRYSLVSVYNQSPLPYFAVVFLSYSFIFLWSDSVHFPAKHYLRSLSIDCSNK